MRRPGELTTEMINLSDCSLHDLRSYRDDDLTAMVETVLRQVERPRSNLGGSGPPGRAD